MTEISEAAKAKALEMLWREGVPQTKDYVQTTYGFLALARFIQEVSDAAKDIRDNPGRPGINHVLAPFILPEPVDHLEQAMLAARKKCGLIGQREAKPLADAFVRELANRGLKIVGADHV